MPSINGVAFGVAGVPILAEGGGVAFRSYPIAIARLGVARAPGFALALAAAKGRAITAPLKPTTPIATAIPIEPGRALAAIVRHEAARTGAIVPTPIITRAIVTLGEGFAKFTLAPKLAKFPGAKLLALATAEVAATAVPITEVAIATLTVA